MITYEEYKEARYGSEGRVLPISAKDALACLRRQQVADTRLPADLDWVDAYRSKPTATVDMGDGWTVKFTLDYDECPDLSYYGEFTDAWEPGAIVNPEHHRYGGSVCRKYFIPSGDRGDTRKYLSALGVSCHEAAMAARANDLADMNAARGDEIEVFCMDADAIFMDTVLGGDSLSGIDVAGGVRDPYLLEVACDLAAEALSSGKEKLKRILEAAR